MTKRRATHHCDVEKQQMSDEQGVNFPQVHVGAADSHELLVTRRQCMHRPCLPKELPRTLRACHGGFSYAESPCCIIRATTPHGSATRSVFQDWRQPVGHGGSQLCMLTQHLFEASCCLAQLRRRPHTLASPRKPKSCHPFRKWARFPGTI